MHGEVAERPQQMFMRVAVGIHKQDVDAAIDRAYRAGAKIQKSAVDAFWGGYSGYFFDPDGHLWEVAFNPDFPLTEDGRLTLPA